MSGERKNDLHPDPSEMTLDVPACGFFPSKLEFLGGVVVNIVALGRPPKGLEFKVDADDRNR